jgi:predicted phage-related endonuclease
MSYLAQCHWYLALSNLDHCDLAVLFGNSDFRIYQIERDCEVQNLLIEQAVHFWENHVLADIPPDPKTTGDLQSLFQTEVAGKTICADAHTAKLVMQFHQITQEIDVKELEVTRIKQQIMTQMGEAEKLIYQDQILATWKKPKASMRFDSKRFEQEHPELYPLYQAPIANSRRLVIKDCQYTF